MGYADPRPTAVCDTECFWGYWAIAFRCVDTGRSRLIDTYPGKPLDLTGLATMISKWRLITFNGNHYDLPMIMLAMSGVDTDELKVANDLLITTDMKSWEFLDRKGLRIHPKVDHIDLIDVAPGRASLKIYGGRIHTKRMQDLPFPHDFPIETPGHRAIVRDYLINDLNNTIDIYKELKTRIDLRCLMSDQYGSDLRSKSDQQLAEAVIKYEVEKITGKRLWKPNTDGQQVKFRYRVPSFIEFETPECQEMLSRVKQAYFSINHKGSVDLPSEISTVTIAGDVYRMGIGGLHSSEKKRSFVADEEFTYLDRDVTSYYPMIILALGLYPPHIGKIFSTIFQGIVRERVAAKRAGDKEKAEMFKIVVNGCFGKFGNKYSFVYAPDLLIQTTVTGQLALLMLIERLSLAEFKVISANTDGVTTQVAHERRDEFNAVLMQWEWDTTFATEEVEYRAVHQRDVNNYIAIKKDGSFKSKGFFAIGGLQKNPNNVIAIEAAIKYLTESIPVSKTVLASEDIRKFLTIRKVEGGARKYDDLLGKSIRYYYAEIEPDAIYYVKNGNTVPRTEGAVPLMELPDRMPEDIDYEIYIREAEAMLQDVGVPARDPALVGRKGVMLARLPSQRNVHLVKLPDGIAICGRFRTSLRDRWVEYQEMPFGHRMCAACRREDEL